MFFVITSHSYNNFQKKKGIIAIEILSISHFSDQDNKS